MRDTASSLPLDHTLESICHSLNSSKNAWYSLSLPLDHTLKSKLESICHSHTYLHWHLGILSTCGAVDFAYNAYNAITCFVFQIGIA